MNIFSCARSSGNGSQAITSSGYTFLPKQTVSRVIIVNNASGAVAVSVQQDAAVAAIIVPAGQSFTFNGLQDASQLGLQAASGTPTITYRWEH